MTSTNRSTPPPIGATILGYPRIGRNRELKRSLESYWDGGLGLADLANAVDEVRSDAWKTQSAAGLATVPTNTFSLYDQVLDASVLLGAIPERHRAVPGQDRLLGIDLARYFAMARGTDAVAPLEMTKWFDTNYHYLAPEVGPETVFRLDPAKVLEEHAAARAAGVASRPVIIGPWTYLSVAKPADGAPDDFDPLERLGDLIPLYADLLGRLADAGVSWVQIDEPALVRALSSYAVVRVHDLYTRLAATRKRPAILVATYFGSPVEALPALAATDIEGIALDLTRGVTAENVRELHGLHTKAIVVGAVDGRNVWRTHLRAVLAELEEWRGLGREIAVSTSCSMLHVPYDTTVETGLNDALRANLAFADQKLAEVVALQQALDGDPGADRALVASTDAYARRSQIPGLARQEVTERVAAVIPADRQRPARSERATAQAARLNLPSLPLTTVGSFPQTPELRRARAARTAGKLSHTAYADQIRREIKVIITMQETLGFDVLVHGEPERNDMVQYFAEQLDGYAVTFNGWVQSYGSRCVRPPILYGDVQRRGPITVPWAAYAQSLTSRPVKGMLTGPVTMLAWSFVREDQPRAVTADQVALALRDEVADLEDAGLAVVQVDEPALREALPLRADEQKSYLEWAVGAFRLATSGVAIDTQVHTHLCYSELGEIIDAIDGLDADVTSVEAARSRMELLGDVRDRGFGGQLGPGVYDIHSPRVPSSTEIAGLLRKALEALPLERLWVNPDCGLKTRTYAEVEPSLRAMVAAARAVRIERGVSATLASTTAPRPTRSR